MKEDCIWNASGYCGCREVDNDLCYSKCAHFMTEDLQPPRKNCPDCIDPMDALTDPNNNEGWIHLNPIQEDLSPVINPIPSIPEPESLSFSKSPGNSFLRDSSFNTQVGGSHYQHFSIQPMEFFIANQIPYAEAAIIKYVCRHSKKNGKEDLLKARHIVDMLIEKLYPSEKL